MKAIRGLSIFKATITAGCNSATLRCLCLNRRMDEDWARSLIRCAERANVCPAQGCTCVSRCVVLVFACCVLAHAQGGVPLKTVVTDQTQLNLSGSFGTPAATAIDQKGDFAFVGEGNSALFVRAAGASSVTRLLQNGDAVPGISGSVITSFVPAIFESQAGVLFSGDVMPAGGLHQPGLSVLGG